MKTLVEFILNFNWEYDSEFMKVLTRVRRANIVMRHAYLDFAVL